MPEDSPPPNYHDLVAPTVGTAFAGLRPGQESALQQYAASEYRTRDLAIELPTGAGKTLIALLILDYWRRQNFPVAILTGNKTLARQIAREAKVLQVPVARFEGKGATFP